MSRRTTTSIQLRYGVGEWKQANTSLRLTLNDLMLAQILTGKHVDLWLHFDHHSVMRVLALNGDPFYSSGSYPVRDMKEGIDMIGAKLIECNLIDPLAWIVWAEKNGY